MRRQCRNSRRSFQPESKFFPVLRCIASLCVLLLSGCGSSVILIPQQQSPTGPPPSATQSGTVRMTPAYAALGQGDLLQFTDVVSGGGSLQWLVNGIAGGDAAVGTVDASGR